ncbi:MAG: TetR/AcrR family transcriptional regulator [Actinomycetota bacterium]
MSTGTAPRAASAATAVRPPKPVLSQRAERELSARHREVLDALERTFLVDGFRKATVGGLAATVGCSRRTLYELARSKHDLVLLVLDRFLHRVGRTALDGIDPTAPYTEQVRRYFVGAVELQRRTSAFADDLADDPAARRLFDRHFRYVVSVIERLVHEGITAGELRPVSPAIVAAVFAGSGLYALESDVLDDLDVTREDATTEIADLIVQSLQLEHPSPPSTATAADTSSQLNRSR